MSQKTCAICGRPVYSGTGIYYSSRPIHRWREVKAETRWFRRLGRR